MPRFIDWAADQFKKDAEQMGHMPLLLKSLREESDERWVVRVMPVTDTLMANFVMETGQDLYTHSMEEDAVRIFNKLKEILTPEVPRSSEISSKT